MLYAPRAPKRNVVFSPRAICTLLCNPVMTLIALPAAPFGPTGILISYMQKATLPHSCRYLLRFPGCGNLIAGPTASVCARVCGSMGPYVKVRHAEPQPSNTYVTLHIRRNAVATSVVSLHFK